MLNFFLSLGITIVLLSCWLGGRLLSRGISERSIPEVALGAYFLVTGSGYLPRLIGIATLHAQPELSAVLMRAAHAGFILGPIALAAFTWRTFRPGNALVAALTGAVGMASIVVAIAAVRISSGLPGESPVMAWRVLIATSIMLWAAGESLREWLAARRRQAIGLCSAPIANRFLLWSVAMASAAILTLQRAAMAATVSNSGDVALNPLRIGLALIAVTAGCAQVGSIWFTFYPPARYTRWLMRREAGA